MKTKELLSYNIENICDSKVVESCVQMIIVECAFPDIFYVVIIKDTCTTIINYLGMTWLQITLEKFNQITYQCI